MSYIPPKEKQHMLQNDLNEQLCPPKLEHLEYQIKHSTTITARSIALAQIKRHRLYRSRGADTFKEYLRSGSIELAYSTAIEQAKIGEVFLYYRVLLQSTGFCEAHGMKKLLHLRKALSLHPVLEVFEKLHHESYRGFKDYAENARAFCNPEQLEAFEGIPFVQSTHDIHRVFEQEGKLYVDVKVEGKELLSFNEEFFNEPETAAVYKRFIVKIIAAAKDFFEEGE